MIRLDFETVKSILPQDIPFLMIDRVIEKTPKQQITCLKNISGNDLVFLGHFPGKSIFPGVLITEAFAQAAILLFSEPDENHTDLYLLASTKLRFLKPVVPGDQLFLNITVVRATNSGAIVDAVAKVDEEVVAKGQLSFSMQAS